MSQILIQFCIAIEMKRQYKLTLGFLLSLFCMYQFLVVTENPRLLDFNRDLKSLVKPNHSTAIILPQAKPKSELLIVVTSKTDNFLARKAIRETWGKSEPVIFLLGKSKSSVKNELVQIESKDFGDVLMEDFIDDYYNLTLKSIMMLKYVTQLKSKPTFVLKVITQNVAFEFWHFPPIFALLKLICLVILFDRKLQIFKNSPNWAIFGILN